MIEKYSQLHLGKTGKTCSMNQFPVAPGEAVFGYKREYQVFHCVIPNNKSAELVDNPTS